MASDSVSTEQLQPDYQWCPVVVIGQWRSCGRHSFLKQWVYGDGLPTPETSFPTEVACARILLFINVRRLRSSDIPNFGAYTSTNCWCCQSFKLRKRRTKGMWAGCFTQEMWQDEGHEEWIWHSELGIRHAGGWIKTISGAHDPDLDISSLVHKARHINEATFIAIAAVMFHITWIVLSWAARIHVILSRDHAARHINESQVRYPLRRSWST